MADALALVLSHAPVSAFAAAPRPEPPTAVRNLANNFSPAGQEGGREGGERRRARRRERYALRAGLRKVTRVPRFRQCGYTGVMGGDVGPGVRLTVAGGAAVAGLSGLSTCGSVWACPVCSAKIATARASDLADVMRHGFRQGCEAAMITLTMRHHPGQTLKQCWDALSAGWHAVTSGKGWVADKARAALRGWVRAVEVTRGDNGWHVHVHALLIFGAPVTPDALRGLADRMWARWDAALVRAGFSSLRDVAADIRKASLTPGHNGLHTYFTKLAHEITGGGAKLARGGGRTPFQVLTDATATGEKADLDLWWEWEASSRGRRQIAWSQGLREWAGLGAELTDDEIAASSPEGDDMLFVDAGSWRHLRHDPAGTCALLEAAESGGYQGARDWLRSRGYGFAMVKLHHRE